MPAGAHQFTRQTTEVTLRLQKVSSVQKFKYRLTYPCIGFAHLIPSRHLVTALSHRSCDLLLKATRGVTIAVVSSRERKRRQPGLATDDPAFVGWHQLVWGIQGS
jgi:hypothetical protein